MTERLVVSAPGRICLFGEHQDYLGLPVVAAAIDRRLVIEGTILDRPVIELELPDIDDRVRLELGAERLPYTGRHDWYRSVVHVLRDEGVKPRSGLRGRVTSRIPIAAGTSSSSALVVAWTRTVLRLADDPRGEDADFVADVAYRAEVVEHGEAGGTMDQQSIAHGRVIHLDPGPGRVEALDPGLGALVLADSGQPKATQAVLSRVKASSRRALAAAESAGRAIDLRHSTFTELSELDGTVNEDDLSSIRANLLDRDLAAEAVSMMRRGAIDHRRFGQMLSEHHRRLADVKDVSTPAIERLLEIVRSAGALGGKINGSGGGGCLVAYAPDRADEVVAAVRKAGFDAWRVEIDRGVSIDAG